MKALFWLATGFVCATPALAAVSVTSPVNGASVTSPFNLSATASPCSSQAIASMGYSLDSGPTTTVKGASIMATVSAMAGAHVLHVKSWGTSGAACGASVNITVVQGAATTNLAVTAPVSGSTVTSPVAVVASATLCSGQPVTTMGYALDGGATTTVSATAINTSLSAAAGSHTLHVKSWGSGGAACSSDTGFSVASTTNVMVSSPANGATVGTPFVLAASGTLCKGQAITSMGYSLDSGATTKVIGTSLNAAVAASAGSHVLQVKSWGGTASCATNLTINVTVPITSPSIPANAVATKLIQNLDTWTAQHDAGTSGTSTGTMSLVATPSISGSARQFATTYTSYGGERYNVRIPPDAVSTNFVYDARVYIEGSASGIANIEMDLNQVLGNGNTVIYGFQCDGWSKTWDYGENSGTIANPSAHWLHSNQACNPQKWAVNTWHHVQIQYSRDTNGDVTYHGVWIDGAEQDLNITVLSEFALGWGPSLNSNFQIDGFTSMSGSSTVYVDNLTLYSW